MRRHHGLMILDQVYTRLSKAVEKRKWDFNASVNALIAYFLMCTDIQYQLFVIYCMPLYGSQLWDFDSNECDFFTQHGAKQFENYYNYYSSHRELTVTYFPALGTVRG